MSAARYFPDDHPALREALEGYLRSLGARLARQDFSGKVAALLLAGGYGRGEGGVLEENGTARLYNDLEFYLVLNTSRGVAGRARRWCAEESHRGEEETGIEVEFKILTLAALRRAEPTMFYYDLLSANVCVFGDAALADRLPPALRDGARLPASEAARLLFNRGTGLLLSRQALEQDSGRVRDGFVERNHAKARLAFADAVLAINGRYHFSCIRRAGRLLEPLASVPPNWPRLVAWHGEAVEFKFHPRHEHSSRALLLDRQEQLVAAWHELFLWLESRRLGEDFPDAAAYALYGGRLFPGSNPLRNMLLHLRDRLRGGRPLCTWSGFIKIAAGFFRPSGAWAILASYRGFRFAPPPATIGQALRANIGQGLRANCGQGLRANIASYRGLAPRATFGQGLRANVPAAVLFKMLWTDYPRAALQRSLALLLLSDPGAGQGAGPLLGLPEGAGIDRIRARYEECWRRYN